VPNAKTALEVQIYFSALVDTIRGTVREQKLFTSLLWKSLKNAYKKKVYISSTQVPLQ
jgi:hypothetical protein